MSAILDPSDNSIMCNIFGLKCTCAQENACVWKLALYTFVINTCKAQVLVDSSVRVQGIMQFLIENIQNFKNVTNSKMLGKMGKGNNSKISRVSMGLYVCDAE